MGAGGETGRGAGAGAEAGRGSSPAVPAGGGSKDALNGNGKAKRPRMPEDNKGASPSAGELLVVVHEALSH